MALDLNAPRHFFMMPILQSAWPISGERSRKFERSFLQNMCGGLTMMGDTFGLGERN